MPAQLYVVLAGEVLAMVLMMTPLNLQLTNLLPKRRKCCLPPLHAHLTPPPNFLTEVDQRKVVQVAL